MSKSSAAPTGCFKCGRPGHWSRDCPSSAPDSNPNSNKPNPTSDSTHQSTKSAAVNKDLGKAAEKTKKAPRKRPKLTPEGLLSEDGLGYVLRHFPRAFKYRGRGHEVSDLGNLIGMYEEWHSKLLPYYSFEQFVHKVEQVGSTNRVKMAIRDLREKVANGGDLTKLHEMTGEQEGNEEQDTKDSEDPSHIFEDSSFHNQDDSMQEEIMHEDMLQDIFEKAKEDVSHLSQRKTSENTTQTNIDVSSKSAEAEKVQETNQRNSSLKSAAVNGMTEDQKARIEANRLKALEKAAARKAAAHSLASEKAAAHSLASEQL